VETKSDKKMRWKEGGNKVRQESGMGKNLKK
jgi:hypothetical protein